MNSKLTHMNQNEYKKQLTTDYSMFKTMPGNREVSSKRIESITKNVKMFGQLNPIIVNENYEVIDGQGRLAACKLLEIPVWYIVCSGLTWEHCVAMNSTGVNWAIKNYIDAYADHGPKHVAEEYKKLKKIFGNSRYVHVITKQLLIKICANDFSGKNLTDRVKAGDFRFARPWEEIIAIIEYIMQYTDILTRVGRKEFIIPILVKCYEDRRINQDKLYRQCVRHQEKIHGIGNTKEALDMLNIVYNFGAKKNRIWLEEIFNTKKAA